MIFEFHKNQVNGVPYIERHHQIKNFLQRGVQDTLGTDR